MWLGRGLLHSTSPLLRLVSEGGEGREGGGVRDERGGGEREERGEREEG